MPYIHISRSLGATALTLAIMAIPLLQACDRKAKSAPQQEMTVTVAEPQIDTVVITKSYPGYLISTAKVELVARVNGYLRAKTYESGAFVRKGQVLFRIEDTQYRDAVSQAEAALATAKATHEYNQRNYQAMKKALESDAVSQMSVIQAESDMHNSEAAIKNAAAALETARTNLGYCVVTAPVSGHISASGPDPGDYLAGAGSPVTLATIYDDAVLNAVFNIDDVALIQDIRHGKADGGLDFNAIPLTFEATLDHPYTGKLGYIAPEVDPSTGTLEVRTVVDNAYGELKDGMFTTMTFPTRRIEGAILVKDASISTDQAGKFLYTVNDSGTVIYTPIKVSEIVNDSMRVVTSGLRPGQKYVTQALLKVRDGMKVKTRLVK